MSVASAAGYIVSSLPIVTGTVNASQIPEAAFIDDIESFIKSNGTTVEVLLQELQTLHQYVNISCIGRGDNLPSAYS